MKIKKWVLLFLLLGCVLTFTQPKALVSLTANLQQPFVLVIDPGHGGPDGGAEAADGTQEKNINLAIAKALQKEAESYGVSVVLTRQEDVGLYEEENTSNTWKKLGDLKVRDKIITEADADLAVSIHLNSFWSDTKVHGAQVFYPKSGTEDLQLENEELAKAIQQSLIKGMNDGSNRIELAKDDIYLFKHVERPTILVECGFLSNPEDAANLKQEAYQEKLAVCIMEAIAKKYNLEKQNSQKFSIIDTRTTNT